MQLCEAVMGSFVEINVACQNQNGLWRNAIGCGHKARSAFFVVHTRINNGEWAIGAALCVINCQPVTVARNEQIGGRKVGDGDNFIVIGVQMVGENACGRVKFVEASAIGAHPKPAVGIAEKANHHAVAQAVGAAQGGIGIGADVGFFEGKQPVAHRTCPQVAVGIFVERFDGVDRQRMGVAGNMANGCKGVPSRVDHRDATAIGTHPQSATVLLNGEHNVVGQCAVAGVVMGE